MELSEWMLQEKAVENLKGIDSCMLICTQEWKYRRLQWSRLCKPGLVQQCVRDLQI